MQVEDQVDPVGFAPVQKAVDDGESAFEIYAGGRCQKVVVHRQPDRIEPPLGQAVDVLAANKAGPIGLEEGLGILRPDELRDDVLECRGGVGERGGAEHVAFGDQPAAESHAAEEDLVVGAIDDIGA